jgi:hypothetical protein
MLADCAHGPIVVFFFIISHAVGAVSGWRLSEAVKRHGLSWVIMRSDRNRRQGRLRVEGRRAAWADLMRPTVWWRHISSVVVLESDTG